MEPLKLASGVKVRVFRSLAAISWLRVTFSPLSWRIPLLGKVRIWILTKLLPSGSAKAEVNSAKVKAIALSSSPFLLMSVRTGGLLLAMTVTVASATKGKSSV